MKNLILLILMIFVQMSSAQIMIPFGESLDNVMADYKIYNMDRGFTNSGALTLRYKSSTSLYNFMFSFDKENKCNGGVIAADTQQMQEDYLRVFSTLTKENSDTWIGSMNDIIFRVTMYGVIGDPVCIFIFKKWQPDK